MNTLGESVWALGLIVMTLTWLDHCHGQSPMCSGPARPHPRGLCGERLAHAHFNLCFLLRQEYPGFFGMKRSQPSSLIASSSTTSQQQKRDRDPQFEELVYSIPLDVLADLDLTQSRNNLGELLSRDAVTSSKEEVDEWNLQEAVKRARFGKVSGMMMELLQGRRHRRQDLDSNMVCECCYNVCGPRQLGAYC